MDKMNMENVNKQAATTGDYEHVGIGGVPDWMSYDLKGAATAIRNYLPGEFVVFTNEPKAETVTLSGSEMKAMQADYEEVVAELHKVSQENTQLKSKVAYRDKRIEDDAVRLKASRKLRKFHEKEIKRLKKELDIKIMQLEIKEAEKELGVHLRYVQDCKDDLQKLMR